MSTEEATINPDGSTTFGDSPPTGDPSFGGEAGDGVPVMDEETMQDVVQKGTDPALYLLFAVFLIGLIYGFYLWRKRSEGSDDFFAELDGDKFNIKLPAAVEEYYEMKEKVMKSGWKPGSNPKPGMASQTGPHRVMAQALMKRAIAGIPIVLFIQQESPGMNKLYSQSMCSVRQWKAYQAAESLVSSEVEEVKAEADDIEPGWSQVIWKQAMQYHTMLKQKHEQEAKQAADQAAKRKQIEANLAAARAKPTPEQEAAMKAAAAEKAAQELIKQEEREKANKSFSGGGMKKGFLKGKSKK